jgi:hypothetical protein
VIQVYEGFGTLALPCLGILGDEEGEGETRGNGSVSMTEHFNLLVSQFTPVTLYVATGERVDMIEHQLPRHAGDIT